MSGVVEKAPLTRKTLDKLTCQSPGCTHESHEGLVLHGRCHLKAPSIARYRTGGVVEISCLTCEHPIAEVAVNAQERAAADEALACTDPHCKEPPENHCLVFRAPCHRKAGVFVTYQDGHLLLTCGECDQLVGVHHVDPGSATA